MGNPETVKKLRAIWAAKEEEKNKKGGAAMSSVLSEDTSSLESATLEPTITGKGKPVEGEALVLPAKATVVLKKSKRGKKRQNQVQQREEWPS